MFKKISSLLREIHSDNQDNLSWTRIISTGLIINIMSVWTKLCIHTGSFVDFTDNQKWLIVAILTAKVSSKALELAGESKMKSLEQ